MTKILAGALLALAMTLALAQEDAVVITATRVPQPSLEIPASVDRLYADEIREGRPQVNLSESLGRVPGIVVQNRQNYAQDLQISSRGFGARATFGVRGIRLIADGIPATMPDGQGQASTFALGSAERIEVLRGPFSSLYGNASGGVIVVESADPPERPTIDGDFLLGKYGTWRAGTKLGGYNALLDASRFETDGYREHSAARRDHFNLKFKYGLTPDTSLTLVGNQLRQPETQDPLGLRRDQFDANPRQAVSQALTFNTRKTVYQEQLGATLAHRLTGDSRIQGTVYGGSRWVEQYLAIPLDTQNQPTHSGGVVQLDRGYGGGALRAFTGWRDVRLSLGLEHEAMSERRRGFLNESGVQGALKRDEDNEVTSTDLYAQAEWRITERWSAHGGARHSRVAFSSVDHFITADNPNDSGEVDYRATTPVAGLLFRPTKLVSLYGNVGKGFETPTFVELAHRSAGSGLNFELQASRSRHAELGVKAIVPRRARLSAAVFDISTENEIVVEQNTGGRATFKNAGHTDRSGIELGAETILGGAFEARFAYTYLEAVFRESFATVAGTPAAPITIPAGNRIPGVPRSQLYGELRYRAKGFYTQLEALRRSRVAVDDANSEFADAYSVFNLVAGLVQQGSGWRVTEFVRLDNFTDRNYAGSVIVNEGNRRFYEPSPRRSMSAGIQASLRF
jgi:iron complex outermembrane receptor protein